MNRMILILALLVSCRVNIVMAQVGINADNSQPDPSAMLDVKTDIKGFLPPRMTYSQLQNISSPAQGLLVFCPDCGISGAGAIVVFLSNGWYTLSASCIPPWPPVAATNTPLETQIIWNWNPVAGATGYKWNTANDFGTAIDLETATSKPESGLSCGTSYARFVWAYNTCGSSTVLSMTQSTLPCQSCGQPLTDGRDGHVYNTVQIGTQCWFAENLNVGQMINSYQNQLNNGIIEKYCYDNLTTGCNVYGGLYQWDEMMQYVTSSGSQGICPDGWHVPSDTDWTTLTDFLGGESVAGGKLKEAGLTHWAAPNTGATNISGFTALPGGYRGSAGDFYTINVNGFFRTSTQNVNLWSVWIRTLYTSLQDIIRATEGKEFGFSVRCIRNQ